MKNLFSFFFLLCLFSVAAQDTSLVNLSKITFVNATEKPLFQELNNGKRTDALSMLFAIDGTQQGKWKTEELIESISKDFEKDRKKGVEKFAKAIHKSLHTNQLLYYQEISTLSETMNQGAYNCVSATALFALVFEKMGYPVAIHQTPNHVYLVVEPQGANIVVETTAANRAQLSLNENFKKSYLEYLRKAKMISPKETVGKSSDEIFNQYYFGDEVITLQQLAGIQYYNDGLLHYEKEAFEEALAQFEKAYLLYPCERFRFLMNSCVGNLLDHSSDKSSSASISFMAKFLKYSGDPSSKEYVEQNFRYTTQKMLLEKPDLVGYNAYADQLIMEVENTALDSQFLFIKYLNIGKYYGLKREFGMAKNNIVKAAKINPAHLEAKNLLLLIELENLRRQQTSPQATIDSLAIFCAEFPEICQYPEIRQVKVSAKLYALMEASENAKYDKLSDEQAHAQMIKVVEELEPEMKDLPENPEMPLHFIFGEIAAYEFRKQNYDKAIDWLHRGLKVYPNNPDLKSRLKNMEDFTKKK